MTRTEIPLMSNRIDSSEFVNKHQRCRPGILSTPGVPPNVSSGSSPILQHLRQPPRRRRDGLSRRRAQRAQTRRRSAGALAGTVAITKDLDLLTLADCKVPRCCAISACCGMEPLARWIRSWSKSAQSPRGAIAPARAGLRRNVAAARRAGRTSPRRSWTGGLGSGNPSGDVEPYHRTLTTNY